ncbi:programmed cell death 1 ligand 1-like [Tachysurus fulvidraco]|uniref:programmed cell death 1 ligand 1-like n=1 Tax=Tachysurus fulvidraco TaxID=1234273 RepID=UPI000F50E9E4|nr:programmed cell death 1 ligand 1-like [Tachysurus fulvidraco]XP_047675968.1 programmed cell death 1 ligand 1-like [Tachysurus fulvidraco]
MSFVTKILTQNSMISIKHHGLTTSYCIIWFVSIGFLTADSEISARVGSTVILPCEWRDVHLQIPHVQWNTVSETVFERKGVEMYVGEGYQGRVDVPQDKLLKGNCSLVLKNVTLTDAGVYESYLSVRRMKRSSSTKWVLVQWLKLSVDETPEETVHHTLSARETPEEDLNAWMTDDAGVTHPGPQIILLSLLACLCVLHF